MKQTLKDVMFDMLPSFDCLEPLTTTLGNLLPRPFLAINCQPLELESCWNTLRIQQVFLLTWNSTFIILV